MSDRQDIATRASNGGVQQKGEDESRRPVIVLRPPADVFEDGEGITIALDMPGVSKDRLNIQTDNKTLTISGDVEFALPQGMEAMLAEVQSTHYRRSFALSGELEPGQAEASLKDGVLSLRIPKRAELRPRRIEVRAA